MPLEANSTKNKWIEPCKMILQTKISESWSHWPSLHGQDMIVQITTAVQVLTTVIKQFTTTKTVHDISACTWSSSPHNSDQILQDILQLSIDQDDMIFQLKLEVQVLSTVKKYYRRCTSAGTDHATWDYNCNSSPYHSDKIVQDIYQRQNCAIKYYRTFFSSQQSIDQHDMTFQLTLAVQELPTVIKYYQRQNCACHLRLNLQVKSLPQW